MSAYRMVPLLWLRLFVTICFGAFVAYEKLWLVAAVAGFFAVVTVLQLRSAYRQKARAGGDNSTESLPPSGA